MKGPVPASRAKRPPPIVAAAEQTHLEPDEDVQLHLLRAEHLLDLAREGARH